VHLSPPEAVLWVDAGQNPAENPLVLAVGDHTLIVRAKGYVELRRSLVVQGRKDDITLTLSREPVDPTVAAEPQPSVTPRAQRLDSATASAASVKSDHTPM
jgi:hypothetical protein